MLHTSVISPGQVNGQHDEVGVHPTDIHNKMDWNRKTFISNNSEYFTGITSIRLYLIIL